MNISVCLIFLVVVEQITSDSGNSTMYLEAFYRIDEIVSAFLGIFGVHCVLGSLLFIQHF